MATYPESKRLDKLTSRAHSLTEATLLDLAHVSVSRRLALSR